MPENSEEICQGCKHPKSKHAGQRGFCNVLANEENRNQKITCKCERFIWADSPDEF